MQMVEACVVRVVKHVSLTWSHFVWFRWSLHEVICIVPVQALKRQLESFSVERGECPYYFPRYSKPQDTPALIDLQVAGILQIEMAPVYVSSGRQSQHGVGKIAVDVDRQQQMAVLSSSQFHPEGLLVTSTAQKCELIAGGPVRQLAANEGHSHLRWPAYLIVSAARY